MYGFQRILNFCQKVINFTESFMHVSMENCDFFELETISLLCTLNSKMDEKLVGQFLFILNL